MVEKGAQEARAHLSNKNSRDKVVLVREPNNPACIYSIEIVAMQCCWLRKGGNPGVPAKQQMENVIPASSY